MGDQRDQEQIKTANLRDERTTGQPSVSKPKVPKSKFKAWLKNKHIQNTLENIKNLQQEPKIARILNETILDNKEVPFSQNSLEDTLRERGIMLEEAPYDKLLLNLHQLEHECGIELSIIKLADGTFEVQPRRTISNTLIYRVRNHTIKNLTETLAGAVHFKPGQKRLKCPIDEIEIEHITKGKTGERPLYELFSQLENEVYPTVIKYEHLESSNLIKKLFVYMPVGLNASQLFSLYGTTLTEMRDQFYGLRIDKGRHSTRETERKIRKIIRESGGRMKIGGKMKKLTSTQREELIRELAKLVGREESYIRKPTFRRVIREELNNITQRRIEEIISKAGGKKYISSRPIEKIYSLLASKLGMSRSRLVKEHSSFIQSLIKRKTL